MTKTSIEWADYSANSWRGCSRIALGCTHCYAATLATRFPATFGRWGTEKQGGVRVVADLNKLFRDVRRWDRKAASATVVGKGRPIVFWNDVSDTFEDWQGPLVDRHGRELFRHPRAIIGDWIACEHSSLGQQRVPVTMSDVRASLFAAGIDPHQNLTHVLLTKRPDNVRRMWQPISGGCGGKCCEYRGHAWLLYSASDQATLEAGLPHLLACRDLVPVLGLSLEPLVGPITRVPLSVGWVIVGGESGPNARPCNVDWIRSIVEQCREVGVPCFVKQLGANCIDTTAAFGRGNWPDGTEINGFSGRVRLHDHKGGDPSEWPEDLRVREFPK